MAKTKEEKLKGIGGWLILLTIGLFLGTLIFLYYTFIFLSSTLYDDTGIAYVGFIIYGAITFLYIFALIYEFKHKKEFPKWAIITLWGSLILLYLFISTSDFFDEIESSDLFLVIIGNIIWTWYLKVSKRVKNTFIK